MEITDELLDRLAKLSMLSVQPDEREKTKGDLEQILTYVGQIEELERKVQKSVKPHRQTQLRPDEEQPSLSQREVLQNAPETDGEYWLVPKTVE